MGGYYAHPLYADRWTEKYWSAGKEDPRGIPEMRHTFIDTARLDLLDDHVLSSPRRRPATLLELLWYGIEYPEVISPSGPRRLYASGSIAWRHWEIDGAWTRHIPYLSDCSGRVRLAELDEHWLPRRAAGEPVAFLYAIE